MAAMMLPSRISTDRRRAGQNLNVLTGRHDPGGANKDHLQRAALKFGLRFANGVSIWRP